MSLTFLRSHFIMYKKNQDLHNINIYVDDYINRQLEVFYVQVFTAIYLFIFSLNFGEKLL